MEKTMPDIELNPNHVYIPHALPGAFPRKVECALCGKPAWVEKDREEEPGRFIRFRGSGCCRCRFKP